MGQLHQHDVIVKCLVVITLMPVDFIDCHVLLCALIHPDVVITQDDNLRVGTEMETQNEAITSIQKYCSYTLFKMVMLYKLLPAVGSRNDPLVVDEGTTTEVVADVKRYLPGLFVSGTLPAPNNLVISRGCSCRYKI